MTKKLLLFILVLCCGAASAAPVITSFTPTSAGPNMTVVITGTGFTGATAVKFGNTNAKSYTVNSSTKITAVVNTGTTGSVSVTAGGSTGTKAGFTFVNTPTITSFTPTSSGNGLSVVITGTFLTGATAVTFGGTAATSYTVNSATQITAVVGTGTTGSVVVTTAGGTATKTGFTWVAAPTITSFTPTSAGPTISVVITGTNFTAATAVTFGGTAATSYTVNSSTQITAVVGSGTTGSVAVTTAGGTGTKTGFTWFATPTITSFTPTSRGNGLTVVITGTNFTGATAVTFGGTAATAYTVNSATQITATVGAGTSGSVAVTTPGGTATQAGFTWLGAPTITAFSPASSGSGLSVVITGTNFTSVTGVSFGGTAAASYTVNSSTQITAVVGTGTSGSIAVATNGGTATLAGFIYIPAPTVTGFSPASALAGGTVVITGTNFTGATAVSFGGVAASSYTVNSATQITAVVDVTGASGSVSVTTPGGTGSKTGFTITAPTVTAFTPSPTLVGTTVTITGTGFAGVTAVTFGGTPAASFTVNSTTSITAVVDAGGSSGSVAVTTPGGTGSKTGFVITAPTITSFSPASTISGNSVTITGTNFTGATAVTFGGTAAASYTVNSATSITAVVGNGSSGSVAVTTPGGTATKTGFTIPAPTITSFSPASASSGATVTITGTNFGDVTAVTFGGVAAASYTVVSSTSITAVVGSGAAGSVAVTTPGGTATKTGFTIPAPTITSFSPTSTSVGGTVTITGTNFNSASAVSFGGVAAASYIVVSPTTITAVVPAGGASGSVAVTTPGGTSSLAGFTISQMGYIYVHDKTLNEQASGGQFVFNMTDAGSYAKTFTLDNSPAYIIAGDIGASHTATGGTNADGELWGIGNPSETLGDVVNGVTGNVYHRLPGSSQWSQVTATSATSPLTVTTANTALAAAKQIDGAYYNQFVFISNGNVYFYNAGLVTQIYTNTFTGGNALDVTANGGKVAIIANTSRIYVNSGVYTASGTGTLGVVTGSWVDISGATANKQASRLDMNLAGTNIVYVTNANDQIFDSIGMVSGTVTQLYNTGFANGQYQADIPDIAIDDNGKIYASGNSSDAFQEVWSNSGTGAWHVENQAGYIERLTGGAGGQAWGVIGSGNPNAIYSRTTDGSFTWFDDERIRTSTVGTQPKNNTGTTSAGVTNGNSIMIPVPPGTYTLVQTLPDATWDLGRFKTYVPGTSSIDTNVSTQTVVITVTAGDVVHLEFVNEKLNPTTIQLICKNQILQTFGNDATGDSTTNAGTVTYGAPVQGTVYHYWNTGSPHDGDYEVVKTLTGTWFNDSTGFKDHGGAKNGYFLLVNASYTKDEFYRQRVTNLIPGLSYLITFYAANVSPNDPIKPNVRYGLQDANGVVLVDSTTGDITSRFIWKLYSFTFTATASTADLFLTNANTGGQGNDIVIDDISLNPVILPLPDIHVTPTIAPNVCIGVGYSFENDQPGGIWTSSSPDVASISPRGGDATGLTQGKAVITYTYTNQSACTSTTTTGIIVSAPPSSINVSDRNEKFVCSGQADSLFMSATGGTAPLAYSWSALPANSFDGLSAADSVKQNAKITPVYYFNQYGDDTIQYAGLATDSVGCTISDTVTVIVSNHTAPTMSVSSGNVCLGSSISLTSTLSGQPSYWWSDTLVTAAGIGTKTLQNTTATPTAAGDYTFKLKAFTGFCNVIASTTSTVYPKPSVTVAGPSGTQVICSGGGSSGSIALTSTTSSGTAPYTYAWSGSFVSGPTTSPSPGLQSPTTSPSVTATPTLTGTAAPILGSPSPDTYNYSILVTDAHLCTVSANTNVVAYLSGSNTSFTATVTPTAPATLCSGTAIALTSAYGGGAVTGSKSFAWTGPGGFTSTSQNPATVATATGNYVVTITDGGLGSGCMASAATGLFTVNASPDVTATAYATALCSSNSVDTLYSVPTGGTGSYTYAWTYTGPSGGTATLSSTTVQNPIINSMAGDSTYTFKVMVTNAGVLTNVCKDSATVTVKYANSTGPTISNMAAAANTCVGQTSLSFSPSTAAGTTYTELKPGSGSISAKTTSGSTGGHTEAMAFDHSIGSYFLASGTAGNVGLDLGGTTTTVKYVSFYALPGTEAQLAGATIQRSTNGSFPGTTIATISGTPTGSVYTSIDLSSNTTAARYIALVAASGKTISIAELRFYSAATTSSTNTYLWTATPAGNGLNATTSLSTTATPTTAGSYTYGLKVTDANLCANSAQTAVQKVFAKLVPVAQSGTAGFCGTTGTLQLFGTVSGGSNTYTTYAWTGNRISGSGTTTIAAPATQNPTATIAGSAIGSIFRYNLKVTDSIGCTAQDSTNAIVVSQNPVITATASAQYPRCIFQNIDLTGNITTTTKAPYNYAWTPPDSSVVSPTNDSTRATTFTATATTTAAGNFAYGLLLVDSFNCTATAVTGTIAINDTPRVTITATVPSVLCVNPSSTITLNATATSDNGNIDGYAWDGDGVITASTLTASSTAIPSVTGYYNVTVTDDSGCVATAYTSQVVVDAAVPILSANCGRFGGANGITNYAVLSEASGQAQTYVWTSLSGGRFYTSSTLSVNSDSDISHLPTPYVTNKGPFMLTMTKLNGCKGSGSFYDSTFCGSIVLPVNLLSFAAQKQGSKVALNWSTATEIKNDHFDVQRSDDGVTWVYLGTVKGHGNSTVLQTYSFTDDAPLSGVNYYRLKQVNADGEMGYSEVRKVQFTSDWMVRLYPNPASDHIVLEFNNDKDEKAHIAIQTALGGTVFVKEQLIVKGANRIVINQIQPLAQGPYVIILVTESNVSARNL